VIDEVHSSQSGETQKHLKKSLSKGVLNEEELDEDDKLNILIGLKSLYGLKFENCFNTFEELVTKGRL
jgi:type I site-specific restriction-modification system R (restriction) subunit